MEAPMERARLVPLLFTLSIAAILHLSHGGHAHPSLLHSDKAALLNFKSWVNDPNGSLSNWLDSNHVCNFSGVNCSATPHGNRVTNLSLPGAGIRGPLKTVLANLSHLHQLNLGANLLYGPIPGEFRHLTHLEHLDLNGYGSQGLEGPLPDWIGQLSKLRFLDLGSNQFSGHIPHSIYNCTSLETLDLSANYLSGEIPPQIGSHLTKLTVLYLFTNRFTGSISSSSSSSSPKNGEFISSPDWIGQLSKLLRLDLGSNRFSGQIPLSIFNCSNLVLLDLSDNTLVGEIPPLIGNHLTKLKLINLYFNRLTGTIPSSFSNMSILEILDVTSNNLSGELPSADVLGKLTKLQRLHLSSNHFWSHDNNTNLEPFFRAIGNCSNLFNLEMTNIGLGGELPSFTLLIGTNMSSISFENNRFSGPIPSDIKLLSNLTLLNLSSNLLSGTIPEEITLLNKLQRLFLSNNTLSGPIPSSVGRMASLEWLDLSINQLSGNIPGSFENLKRLEQLLLQQNNLSGEIPPAIGRCNSLKLLVLSYNRLNGSIPWDISNLTFMGNLNLSHNLFEGSLPMAITKMTLIEVIDLSHNNFTGVDVLPQLDVCPRLASINFSQNNLQGQLPAESFGTLKSLTSLDLSYNQLTGSIPSTLNGTNLSQLNLSYNDFIGSIPTFLFTTFHLTNLSFLGNCRLNGSLPGNRTCKAITPTTHHKPWGRSTKIWVITISSAAAMFVLLLFLYYGIKMVGRKRIKIFFKERADDGRASPALKLNFPRITFRELEEATAGFGEGRLIGSGGYGKVYRGTLRDGTQVAIKVLRTQTGNSTKSFNKECQVLKRIRHRNLIRIITACSRPDFKAVVLPFMANGSLESHLYPADADADASVRELSLVQRVNICSDVAEGMAYLHHHSPARVVHGDLKPSNVLLNDDMTALVSDFGNARLLMSGGGPANGGETDSAGASTANMLWGSIGYMAPGTYPLLDLSFSRLLFLLAFIL